MSNLWSSVEKITNMWNLAFMKVAALLRTAQWLSQCDGVLHHQLAVVWLNYTTLSEIAKLASHEQAQAWIPNSIFLKCLSWIMVMGLSGAASCL